MKRPIIIEQFNGIHAHTVLSFRKRLDDIEATRYMDGTISQAYAQIQRPARQATENVRIKLTQRFLEAIR
jgi:hypothetical protein